MRGERMRERERVRKKSGGKNRYFFDDVMMLFLHIHWSNRSFVRMNIKTVACARASVLDLTIFSSMILALHFANVCASWIDRKLESLYGRLRGTS